MKVAALILLSLAIISGLFALKLQKAADSEKRYYQAWNDVERLLPPKNASPEISKAWAELSIREKELYVQRGLGRGVAWMTLVLSALSLISVYLIKTKHPQQNA
jgi:hypothetical protein